MKRCRHGSRKTCTKIYFLEKWTELPQNWPVAHSEWPVVGSEQSWPGIWRLKNQTFYVIFQRQQKLFNKFQTSSPQDRKAVCRNTNIIILLSVFSVFHLVPFKWMYIRILYFNKCLCLGLDLTFFKLNIKSFQLTWNDKYFFNMNVNFLMSFCTFLNFRNRKMIT